MSEATASHRGATTPRSRRPRRWQPYALSSPAVAITTLVFAASMVILLTYSSRAVSGGTLAPGHPAATWRETLRSDFFGTIILRTLKLGALTAVITAVIGYPMAFALYRLRSSA